MKSTNRSVNLSLNLLNLLFPSILKVNWKLSKPLFSERFNQVGTQCKIQEIYIKNP